jgi:hypothetical protein
MVEVKFSALQVSSLYGDEWSTSRSSAFHPVLFGWEAGCALKERNLLLAGIEPLSSSP